MSGARVYLLQAGVVAADALVVAESAVVALNGSAALFGRSSSSSAPSPAEIALDIYLIGLAACAVVFAGGALVRREYLVLANRDLLISNALALYVCAAAFFFTNNSDGDNASFGVAALLAALAVTGGASACKSLALVLRGLSELPSGSRDSFSHDKIRV